MSEHDPSAHDSASGAAGRLRDQGPGRTGEETAQGRVSRQDAILIAVLVGTSFVAMINETSLAVALPRVMEEFSIAAETAQWLLTSVMLTMSIVLPTTGWVIGRFTTRQVYAFAVGSFFLGSVVVALAPSFLIVLLGRILQALGTALLVPLQMTIILTLVPIQRRGTVMGIVAIVMAVGPALGPTYAGLVMSVSTWHMMFWIMTAASAAAGIVGILVLRNVGEEVRTPLDVLSVGLAAVAFGGLVYGLSSVGLVAEGAPGAALAVAIAVAGVLALVAFVWRQTRLLPQGRALLDLSALRLRNYVLGLLVLLIFHAVLLGLVAILPTYLQGALMTTALVAGFANLPGGIIETVLAPVSGALYDRFGLRLLVVPGMVLVAVPMFWMGTMDAESSVLAVIVAFAILSVGIAIVWTPMMTATLSTLPKEVYAHGSAIMNTLMQLFGAAGTAVAITMMATHARAAGNTPQALGEAAGHVFFVLACVQVVGVVISCFVHKPRAAA